MPLDFRFDRLVFSDGTELRPEPGSVLVFVGPNNAGKSATLRELTLYLLDHRLRRVVLSDISAERDPHDLNGFFEWLENNSYAVDRLDGRHYRRPNANLVRIDLAQAEWTNDPPVMPNIWSFFVFHGSADNRLQLVQPSGTYNPFEDAPASPMQVLLTRPDLEERLSDATFEAFGERVTLSRIWGANLDLRVGEPEVEASVHPTPEHLAAIRALPEMQAQGDGVRSFVGVILALITAQYPVMLVDEPEAFLHPPQARLLGRKLVTEVPSETQLFIATHSSDVLQGLLDPPQADVTVVRLTRSGAVNRAAVLHAGSLREMWSDPLLRYSNVLDGLFHRGVIACESDADSRFYSAVLDSSRDRAHLPPHDLLFTHAGGKQRLRTVVRALRAVDVPVAVIADFDVLREEATLRMLFDAIGGSWESVASLWNEVRAAVEDMGAHPPVIAVREEVERVLSESGEHGRLTRDQAGRVRDAVRLDDGWSLTRRGGVAALPQGQASERAGQLLELLAGSGLFVVPVGELERWVPEIGHHGPAWVSDVLTERRHEDETLAARRFVEAVAAWFD